MLTFMENQQLTRANRHDTLATTFFRMTGDNYIVYARFSIRNRKEIHSFIKSLDEDKSKPIDTFFICQELNIKDSQNRPVLFAAFNYFIGALQQTKKSLQVIHNCKILQVSQLRINELFQKMCQTSFIELNMFERLGKADLRILRQTSNPFAEVYFSQDVSLFHNLGMAVIFITDTLSQSKNLNEKIAKRKPITAYQKEYSRLLFGTITRDLIHLCPQDSQSLTKAYCELQKYEIEQEQSFMRDEQEQFQDVEYRQFDQSLQLEGEDREVLIFLKKMRTDSIRGIRQQLKDAERKRQREDISR